MAEFVYRPNRVDLRRPAELIDSDGVARDVTVLDLSRNGFRFQCLDMPRIGELVTLRAERRQEFSAQIRWVLGQEAGGRFLAPIEQASLDVHGSGEGK